MKDVSETRYEKLIEFATAAGKDFARLTRAYLLLQRHGRSLCRRSRPKCSACPIADTCAYLAASAGRRTRARRASA